MRVAVPAEPVAASTDAWRTRVGTGRMNLALRHDSVESLATTQREIGFRHVGRGLLSDDMGVHLHLAQHQVTLVEPEVVRDETAPWTDDTRIPGYAPTSETSR